MLSVSNAINLSINLRLRNKITGNMSISALKNSKILMHLGKKSKLKLIMK